jgi:uncharacterized protein (TIGR02444 family)
MARWCGRRAGSTSVWAMPDSAAVSDDGNRGGDNAAAALDAACDAFWRFSCAVYGRPGIAGSLLALQDEAGADVNLALLCLWLGLRGRPLDAAALAAAERAAEPVRAGVLRPLRAARRGLKALGGPASLYRDANDLELAVEQFAQRALLGSLPPGTVPLEATAGAAAWVSADRTRAAAANLAVYAAYLRVDAGRMRPVLDAGRETFRLSDD